MPKIYLKGLEFDLDFKEFFGLMVYKSKEDIEKTVKIFEDNLGVSFQGKEFLGIEVGFEFGHEKFVMILLEIFKGRFKEGDLAEIVILAKSFKYKKLL